MPRKTKTTAMADKAAQPQFSAELLEQLIPGPVTPAELEGIFQQFKKSVLERALGAEMSHHLGYASGQTKPEGAASNHRNGKNAKTVLTDTGALRIAVPRDREGTFEPQLIGKPTDLIQAWCFHFASRKRFDFCFVLTFDQTFIFSHNKHWAAAC